jgi:general secretion pathway protein A
MLDRPELRQLRQRIVLRHHLVPFDASEVDTYLDERLRLAGYTGKGIFKRSARKALFAVTGGVPRLINVVCDSALLLGYSRQQQVIGDDIVREAAAELRIAPSEPGPADTESVASHGADVKSGRKRLFKRFRLFS